MCIIRTKIKLNIISKYVQIMIQGLLSCLQFIDAVMCDRVNIRINADYKNLNTNSEEDQEHLIQETFKEVPWKRNVHAWLFQGLVH